MEHIDLLGYIKPELFLIATAIYVVGVFLKKSEGFKDKYIPIALGVLSVIACFVYFISVARSLSDGALFEVALDSLIQGIIIAGCAVYTNQIAKQLEKKED